MKVLLGFLQLCILFSAITIHSSESKCEDGWKMKDAKCFKLFQCNGCTVNSAQASCQRKNATLVTIPSSEYQKNLITLMKANINCILFGARYVATERAWKWPDDTVLDKKNKNWAKGEPKDDKGEHCMYVYYATKQWYSIKCGEQFGADYGAYMCEKKK